MATYFHESVLDGGLDYLIAQGDRLRLVNGYVHGASHGTVETNTVAIATISAANWTKSTIMNGRRARIALGLALGNSTAAAAGNLHYAVTRSSDSTVLFVCDAPDQSISGAGLAVISGDVDAYLDYTP